MFQPVLQFTHLKQRQQMKKSLMILSLLASACVLPAQITINTSGTYRSLVADPFGGNTYVAGSFSDQGGLGWKNSGENETFHSFMHFDLSSQPGVDWSTSSVTLNVDGFSSGVATASLWLADLTDINASTLNYSFFNNPIGNAIAPRDGGSLVTVNPGNTSYDITSIIQSLSVTGSTDQLYFRFQVDAPTSTPGGGTAVFPNLDASSLTIGGITPVPEPSTYALFAGAMVLGLVMLRRRRK
jgi:hypothetical protein